MKILASLNVYHKILTLAYDEITKTYWVTEMSLATLKDKYQETYRVSFSLLSEAKLFYDLLVEVLKS